MTYCDPASFHVSRNFFADRRNKKRPECAHPRRAHTCACGEITFSSVHFVPIDIAKTIFHFMTNSTPWGTKQSLVADYEQGAVAFRKGLSSRDDDSPKKKICHRMNIITAHLAAIANRSQPRYKCNVGIKQRVAIITS